MPLTLSNAPLHIDHKLSGKWRGQKTDMISYYWLFRQKTILSIQLNSHHYLNKENYENIQQALKQLYFVIHVHIGCIRWWHSNKEPINTKIRPITNFSIPPQDDITPICNYARLENEGRATFNDNENNKKETFSRSSADAK